MPGQQPHDGPDDGGAPQGAVSDAAGRLSQDVASLVRAELDRAKAELTDTARRAGTGTGAFAVAAVSGVFALVAAHQSLLAALERAVSRRAAAAALTCAYTACAAASAWYGYDRLCQARAASRQALRQMGTAEEPGAENTSPS
ncbi:phage holin family protein [Streptantibioticus cattleyicolor]|uniref:Uncharacterized protein n=1 Tax=Streptantibioticus cattleyicolor (strain ATCC 35852 / DSM 46488 / JCM 4925 / NBRC 14057 / NRRL 8057) TaxID=1003195 RepID=F8JMV4_STREN|nr:phage holin family protein [Streptantibioticus cattleyicolor]AEW99253.1 hypothetical protein SCATT_p10600 [Streptantibioticus cattleyicolor NRRL 8057 = DSM 46488]CCB71704.1 protein of unknown function [Streptantibioticus cattleyicolor NRRL 8057 = DSM 46488]